MRWEGGLEYGEGRDGEAWSWRGRTWIIMGATGSWGPEHTGSKLLRHVGGSQKAGAGRDEGVVQVGGNSHRKCWQICEKIKLIWDLVRQNGVKTVVI